MDCSRAIASPDRSEVIHELRSVAGVDRLRLLRLHGFSRGIYPVELSHDALFLQLGQGIAQPLADHVTPADEVEIRCIGGLEHVFGTTESGDHARRKGVTGLFCAVSEDVPLPHFVNLEEWEYAQALDIAPLSGFDASAAETSAATNGFNLFHSAP
jgi:hypothetical protein